MASAAAAIGGRSRRGRVSARESAARRAAALASADPAPAAGASRLDRPPAVDDAAASGDAQLEEGTRVGDFLIDGIIGEGAMGQVYLARDLTLGRRIALKLIKRSVMKGDGVDRFLEEARATA